MSISSYYNHYKENHTTGIDIPFSLYGVAMVTTWRDHYISNWSDHVTQFKKIPVKIFTEIGIAFFLAMAVGEFIVRNILTIFTLPEHMFTHNPKLAIRIKESALTNLQAGLFGLEALHYNLFEKRLGSKMVAPRLSAFYLDYYSR